MSEVESKDESERLVGVEYEETPALEVEDPDCESGHDGEETVVDLGFSVGERFSSFGEFDKIFLKAFQARHVCFYKSQIETIQSAQRRLFKHNKSLVNYSFKPELKYYYLRYKCLFSGRFKSQGTGASVTTCPASISLSLKKTTDNEQFLEVISVDNRHHHPVSQEHKPSEYGGLTDTATDNIIEKRTTEDKNFRAVLAKGEHIAKLASVSDNKRFHEILKNLDDLILYLKCVENEVENDDDDDDD
ncbi:unnamed protein product [Ceutorhynchus assimilis]|uniref:ZSWIM3 N-terminal domain-containing protein n=1 Tax=Ceutorhynchus assimilis TaxID=467358 RepID=A0A9N9MQC1_9CUCU|nr:unnamed protein product [Ceutorhynchus assimilis]